MGPNMEGIKKNPRGGDWCQVRPREWDPDLLYLSDKTWVHGEDTQYIVDLPDDDKRVFPVCTVHLYLGETIRVRDRDGGEDLIFETGYTTPPPPVKRVPRVDR
jgi:hypothetical protein